MKRIWSRCVGIITSMAGRPPTGPSSEATSDHVLEILQQLYPGQVIKGPSRWSWFKWSVKLKILGFMHLLGIHFPIPVEEWNSEQQYVRFIGDECFICGLRM